ncbi:MAG: hypothetical protein AB7F59_01050 [Bdellovibrionales bacterium]
MRPCILVLLLVFSHALQASVPNSKILESIEKKLDALSTPEAWNQFISENPKLFPEASGEKAITHVVVTREEIKAEGETFVLGVGYRQTFMKAPLERVQKILNDPGIFQALFGLDASAIVDKTTLEKELTKRTQFKARFFKKISLIPNQDYVLDFTNKMEKKLWFQRAKFVEDKEELALRDNLKALETRDGGVIFREISIVYGLKWYVRFLGPTVREVMNKELAKITDSVKCLAEKSVEITTAEAEICWKTASKETK